MQRHILVLYYGIFGKVRSIFKSKTKHLSIADKNLNQNMQKLGASDALWKEVNHILIYKYLLWDKFHWGQWKCNSKPAKPKWIIISPMNQSNSPKLTLSSAYKYFSHGCALHWKMQLSTKETWRLPEKIKILKGTANIAEGNWNSSEDYKKSEKVRKQPGCFRRIEFFWTLLHLLEL